MSAELLRKYNVQAPRYTSYPTVPFWDEVPPSEAIWKQKVKEAFAATNGPEGISLYIHLPYCESLCTYCGCNTRITVNHSVEQPYITSLLAEWQMYLDLFAEKPRIREIHLGGGTPTFFSPHNLERLINGILDPCEVVPDHAFSFEGHPNNTTYEHLKALFDLGFRRVSYGIQDFDPKVQDIINRIQPAENVQRVTEWAREIGYESINFDLVYGLPLQTRASIIKTMHQIRAMRPDRIAFYSYAHVPWIKPGQRKFTELDLPVGEEKRKLYEIGREMLAEMGYVEIGMDHFALAGDELLTAWRKKTLHRNFMGYTPFHTHLSIGLGASSISDSWTAFAQNEKKVEDYQAAIRDGHFPIIKGHVLSEEDLIIRPMILDLMCKMEVTLPDSLEWKELADAILIRLQPLVMDGLAKLESDRLRVMKRGRPFLRNIGMALDARLHAKEMAKEKQVFSGAV